MRLRPRKRVTIEVDLSAGRRTLLAQHVRENGEATPHMCSICLVQMRATDDCVPDWARATCCGEVWHEACLLRYVRDATSEANRFHCPWCKAEHDADDVDGWDASEVVERLFPEDAYASDEEADDSDDDDSQEESEDDDDETTDAILPARVTRSRGRSLAA